MENGVVDSTSFMQLPVEIAIIVLEFLDIYSLARIGAVCTGVRSRNLVEIVLRNRAVKNNHVLPSQRPVSFTSWESYFFFYERYDDRRLSEAWAPVSLGRPLSFFVIDGILQQCETTLGMQVSVINPTPLTGDVPPPIVHETSVVFRSVHTGATYAAAVSTTGEVYTWAFSDTGIHDGSLPFPTRVHGLREFNVLTIAAGLFHCIVVTHAGEILSWGLNENGQCGHGNAVHAIRQPRIVEALQGIHVRSACAGGAHSLIVTKDGSLYSCGKGTDWQLGHGDETDIHYPMKVFALYDSFVVASAASDRHSIALTKDGVVFSWGSGLYNFGMEAEAERYPVQVQGLANVIFVATCTETTCAVTCTGKLYTWGSGDCGKLGHGDWETQLEPKYVKKLRDERVRFASVSEFCTVAVCHSGNVYGWGLCSDLGKRGRFSVDVPHRYAEWSCMP